MNVKQKAFCKEYLVDLNATQAAIRAGYSKKTAGAYSAQLMQTPSIKEEIENLMQERSERTQITADRVLEELAHLAFYDPTQLFKIEQGSLIIADTDSLPEREKRALVQASELSGKVSKLEVKMADKLGALQMLGKHLKMFTDKTEIGVEDGKPLEIIVKPPRL